MSTVPAPAPIQKAQKVVPMPTLSIASGPLAGTRIPLDQEVATLGRRDDNGYVVGDPRISRVHAEIRKEPNAIIVTDLGSSAGTEVNGTRITGPTVLHHGDKIGFGPIAAVLEDPATGPGGDDTIVIDTPKVETGPHLSPRQTQVLAGIAQGMTNSEIGESLGVTERTVKAYAQELFDRLGVRNRAGAVAQGIHHGLI